MKQTPNLLFQYKSNIIALYDGSTRNLNS